MYHHFAGFTVIVTLALALATGDGNAEVFNAAVDDAQAKVVETASKVKGTEQATLVRRTTTSSRTAAAGWGADQGVVEHRVGSGYAGLASAAGYSRADLARIGLTPEQYNAMSSEERGQVARRLAEAQASMRQAELQTRKADIVAASLARAGGGDICTDC